MKLILLFAMMSTAALTTGCAKSSDVEAIGARVTVLEGKVSTLETDVAAAKAAAIDAASKAAAAETAANRAAEFAEETNTIVSKMIK